MPCIDLRGRFADAVRAECKCVIAKKGKPCAESARMKTGAVNRAILERLRRGRTNDLATLMAIWRGRELEQWSGALEIYRLLGEQLLKQGEPLLACDVVREGLGSNGR